MAPFLMDRKPTGDEVVAAMGATGMTEHAMLLTVGGKMVANIKIGDRVEVAGHERRNGNEGGEKL